MAEQEFKDSNIEWIGVIPKSWEIMPNKYVMAQIKDIRPVYKGEQILSLSKKGVIVRDLENPSGKMPKTFDGYQYVKRGNLLMCLFDIDVTPRCIGLIQNDGLCSPAYSQFALNERGYSPYYFYYYLNLDFKKELLHLAKNLRHSLTEEQLGNIPVPCPPIQEQKKIANFLDSKCEEIDALCADIEKQIETLEEYKKSVITEAVTKGLDPNVEMKNSGVEWIGLIPKHWGTLSLQYLLSFSGSGTTPKGLDKLVCEDGNGINWLNTGDLTDSYIESIPQKLKAEVMQQYSSLRLYPSGSLVIAMYGATAGKLGILLEPSMTNQACCVLVPNKDLLNLKYLFYQLLAARSYLVSLAKGGGQPNISQETVRKFKVCFTELQEQSNIVNFLDEKCNIIDGAIEIKKRQLETLAQYKQSLIYEYVTGKKAVPANF